MKKVTAAMVVDKGLILIAKRNKNDKLANKWEFPGGKVEPNETPEESLVREMQEEFQIGIEVKDYYDESIYKYANGAIQLLVYWAEWTSGELKPTVHDEYQWVKAEELHNYDFAPADIPIVEKLQNENHEFLA